MKFIMTLKLRSLIKYCFYGALIVAAFVFVYKFERFENFYYYTFHHGTYVNRTFKTNHHVFSKSDKLFKKIIFDKNFDDRRGHNPNFGLQVRDQITVSATELEIEKYKKFLEKYFRIIGFPRKHRKNMSDKVAFAVMNLAHQYYSTNKKNLNIKRRPRLGFGSEELNYRAEDHVFYVVNAQTACGDMGSALVALLRFAGFNVRLMRVSNEPHPIAASHVFLEFYSDEQRRWVMLDPQINFSPKDDKGNLSAFEMVNKDEIAKLAIDKWKESGEYFGPVYDKNRVIWYSVGGPVMNIYYHAVDQKYREALKAHL